MGLESQLLIENIWIKKKKSKFEREKNVLWACPVLFAASLLKYVNKKEKTKNLYYLYSTTLMCYFIGSDSQDSVTLPTLIKIS